MKHRITAARPFAGLLLATALSLTAAACNDDPPAAPEDTGGDPTGTWAAVAIGGASLPIRGEIQVPDRGWCNHELRQADLTFSAGGTYSWEEEAVIDCPGDTPPETVNNTFSGTWRVEGVQLFMKLTDPEEQPEQRYTFTVSGNSLSLTARAGGTSISSLFQRG